MKSYIEHIILLFEGNTEIIYFIYGLVFFLMGFAILFQKRIHSNIKLASSLKYLALFGITHGLSEWATIFIPIHQKLVNLQTLSHLKVFEVFFTSTSLFFLFLFGLKLLQERFQRSNLIFAIPWSIYLSWTGAFFFNIANLDGDLLIKINNFEALGRYFMAFPGALISGYGLFLHSKHFKKRGMQEISKYFFYAACGFTAYSIAAGLIVKKVDYFPANILNKAIFFQTFGFPVQIFRAICGLVISVFIIKGLEFFNLEYRKRLEEAEKNEALFIERNRICRDLHDGIIQSIYAVGLTMENSLNLVKTNPDLAEKLINQNMEHLDLVIKDIRSYIMELTPAEFDPACFEASLNSLIEQFKINSLIQCSISISPNQINWLKDDYKLEIYHILLEALNNIQKHSRANYVEINFSQSNDTLVLSIKDNGIGFDKEAVINYGNKTGSGQGLKNMMIRANLCNGTFNIDSEIGKGTEIRVVIKKGPGLE